MAEGNPAGALTQSSTNAVVPASVGGTAIGNSNSNSNASPIASPIASTDWSHWYSAQAEINAQDVYQDALLIFSTELSKDPAKRAWLSDPKHANVNSVLASVASAQDHYKKQKGSSKVEEALVSFSETAHFYSAILDALVSHHPEYTALVWGAIKFLFVGVVNHQKVILRLSEGLAQIADLLPRAELVLKLYPIPQMRQIVVAIYARILRFLIRAFGWFRESKVKHMIHAITRPTELRYDDILLSISALSHSMTAMAGASSQAEQRDMHTELREQSDGQVRLQSSVDEVKALILGLGESLAAERSLQQAARIDTRQRLSKIQLTGFLTHIAVLSLPRPEEALSAACFLSSRRRARPSTTGPAFWHDRKVQRWNQRQCSALILITGSRKMRAHLQSFCADSISILKQSNIPVLWALRSFVPAEDGSNAASAIDILRYLATQAIALDQRTYTEDMLSASLPPQTEVASESDWLDTLASAISATPLLYVILDVELIMYDSTQDALRFWRDLFAGLFSRLNQKNSKTVVRAAFVGCGIPLLGLSSADEAQYSSVIVGKTRRLGGYEGRGSRLTRKLPTRGKTGDHLDFDRMALGGKGRSRKTKATALR